MASGLKKDFQFVTTPGSPGTPGDPGSPGAPAYCYQVPVTSIVVRQPTGHWVFQPPAPGSVTSGWIYIPGVGPDVIEYQTTYQTVCLPEVPASPPSAPTPGSEATTAFNFNFGWNSSAISTGLFSGDSSLDFFVNPASIGVVVGLNRAREDDGYSTIDYAFKCTNGSYVVIENGVARTAAATFTSADEFSIQRLGDTIQFIVAGVLKFTSTAHYSGTLLADASLYAAGDEVLSASFGAPTSMLRGDSSLTFQPITGLGGSVTSQGIANLTMQPLSGDAAPPPGYAYLTMQPLSGIGGDSAAGAASLTFAPLTIDAGGLTGVETPVFAVSMMQFQPLQLTAFGELAQMPLTMRPMTMLAADHAGGEASLTMEPVRGIGFDVVLLDGVAQLTTSYALDIRATVGEPNTMALSVAPSLQAQGHNVGAPLRTPYALAAVASVMNTGRASLSSRYALVATGTVFNAGTARLTLFPRPSLTAGGGNQARVRGRYALTASGTVHNTAQARLTLPAPRYALLASASTGNVGRATLVGPMLQPRVGGVARLQLAAYDLFALAEVSAVPQPTFEAYSVNLVTDLGEREGGGNEVTRLVDLPFLQVVRFGSTYYGVTATGIHAIGGDEDAGEPIAWDWRTGMTDFKTVQQKKPIAARIGGRLGQHAHVTVQVSEGQGATQEYSYDNPRGDGAQTYRQTFGLGLKARYIGFGASDSQGGELTVDSLSPELSEMKRSI